MSAVPVIEPAVEQVVVEPRRRQVHTQSPAVIELPIARPVARPETRPRTRKQSQASPLVAQAVAFVLIAAISYFVLSLAGQVMVEKARRDGIRSSQKARVAMRESSVLRERVNELTSARSIESWAEANNFVNVGNPRISGGVGLVALNR